MHNPKNNVVLIFAGTRPEIIKTAPVHKKLLERGFKSIFCATFQHKDLSTEFLNFFDIKPDFVLDVNLVASQGLAALTAKLIEQAGAIIEKVQPACVMVQGDTMTTMAVAQAAFLHKVPVCHVEAGLRSGSLMAPFPEEFNRRVCTLAASLHLVPTENAKFNLLKEGVMAEKISLVGNTVIDALLSAQNKIAQNESLCASTKNLIVELKAKFGKIGLMTMHRRESFAQGLDALFASLTNFAKTQAGQDFILIYPRHPNPATASFAEKLATQLPNKILVLPPLGYAEFITILSAADFVITDSGGVLEEATALNKSVVCVREKIERPEILQSPKNFLTGFNVNLIEQALKNIFSAVGSSVDAIFFNNVFGVGFASDLIVQALQQEFCLQPEVVILPAKLDQAEKFRDLPQAKVAIFGLGYIGLPTATLLAKVGFDVHGVDIDAAKIARILNGDLDLLEGGFKQDFQAALQQGNLNLKTELDCTVNNFIICVPTPLKNSQADVSYVFACAKPVAKFLRPGNLVIIESTVPVGTTNIFTAELEKLSGLKSDQDFFVVYCPERVIPGRMERELVENDRVIGAESAQGFLLASKFYRRFCTGDLSFANCKTAELVKLLENSYRNVQVAFANEAFDMATEFGVNPSVVIQTANKHPRVKILNPGPGVGGHCVAVDPIFITDSLNKQTCPILDLCIEQNRQRPAKIVQQILSTASAEKNHILILGLAYKSDIGDLRESPALEIAQALVQEKVLQVKVYDPYVEVSQKQNLALNFIAPENIATEFSKAEVVAILVGHTSFLDLLESLDLSDKIIIDPTGMLEKLTKKKTTTNQISGFCKL